MTTILIFLLVLTVLVLIHEFGHYFAARLFGVKAEEFGWGFPPRAIGFVRVNGKWKRVSADDKTEYANTVWSLNWFPLGGFVRLKGEEGVNADDKDSFASKKSWQRLIIIAAGVIMNWLLAAAIISFSFAVGVPAQVDESLAGANVRDPKIQIADVLAESPAATAGIQPGDFLVAVNGVNVAKSEAARQSLGELSKEGTTLPITVERADKLLTLETHPALLKELGRPGLGVSLVDTAIVRFPIHLAIYRGFVTTGLYTKLILTGLYDLVHDLLVQREVTAPVSGPIGIAVMTGRIAKQGFWNMMQFTALLSLNLAVINFFPIPALDGGRAVFIALEWIRRRRVKASFEATLHKIGFLVLMALVVLVTIRDVRQYGGVIWTGIKHMVGL
ncbi:MAG: M50 family metallopeptidase [Patescibacteria group bacterium]